MSSVRLDIRLPENTKDLIQQAAGLRNQTITQFVLATLSEEAGKIVQQHQRTVLSDRDRDLFLKMLDTPPKPNKVLKKAAERYKKRHGS